MVGMIYRDDLISSLLNDPAQKAKFEQISQTVLGKTLEPTDPAEWTFDDYLATAAYFTKQYNPDSPTEYGTILPAKNSPFAGLEWAGVLYSMGGSWEKDGKPNFDTPEAKAAVDLYSKAITLGIASPNSAQGDAVEIDAALTSGSAAFAMQWYSSMAGLEDESKSPLTAGNVTFTAIPGEHLGHMHLQGVALNKYGENQDAARKFLEYLLTSEALGTYGANGGMPPAESFLSSDADRPQLDEMGELLQNNTVVEPPIGKADPFTVATLIGVELSDAWTGGQDSAAALEDLQSAVSEAD